LAHGDELLRYTWAESIVKNAGIEQSAVWVAGSSGECQNNEGAFLGKYTRDLADETLAAVDLECGLLIEVNRR
jgi:hypothetical protein